MPQEMIPDMEMPMLVVQTIYPGAGPEDVELLVTSVIKDSLSAESGLRNVISQSMENVSILMLQFEFGYDMNRAYTSVSRTVDGIANRLPDDAMTPIVMEIDMNSAPVMVLSIQSESIGNLRYYVENEIVPQLSRLGSVASVDVFGGREYYIRVEVIEEMLREHNLTSGSVIQAISGAEFAAPLGTAAFGNVNLGIRIEVAHESIAELSRIPITLMTGDVVRVADVANITVSTKDAASISRHNGMENITVNIQNPQAVSANRTSGEVTRVINSILRDNPDISITVVDDESDRIAESIFSIAQTLILAVLLAMIVLWLFLGDFRAALIVGSSMPISLIITFIFMDFMGYTLNMISMSGLVIGVGMMVDNAIVVIDSCMNAKKQIHGYRDSAVAGTKAVLLSIMAVTLTTVAVFVPLATIDGMAGQMFAPLGFSIVFALVASLVSAITLVPLFFVRFRPIERENAPIARLFKRIENGYARILQFTLRKKAIVVLATIGIMVLTVFLAATFMNFELMPPMDEGIVSISVNTRPGLNLESVDAILVDLEDIVAVHPDVESFTLRTGMGGATLTAFLYSNREMQTSEVIEQFRFETGHILNADIDITSGSIAMAMDAGVGIMLEGDDLDSVRDAAAMVENIMNSHPDVIRVNSSVARATPQAEIRVDPFMAAARNVVPQMVLSAVFLGLNGTEVSAMTIDGQRYSVWVQYPQGRYESVSDIQNMMIMSATGMFVPLSDIATIQFTDTPQIIFKQNGMYSVTISAVTSEAARFTAAAEILASVNELDFPHGVGLGRSLNDEMMIDELTALGMAIVVAILLVFMVMSIQFESVRHSLMVMTCIPLAVIGSLFLMILAGVTINMVSLLGFLILISLVVNNGILFVDTANRNLDTMELYEALIHAGRTRLRPILMITLTSVLAMLPLALGIGDDMMQGLGITVIGGLTASTLLALLLLPTFYLIIGGKKARKARERAAAALAEENQQEVS